MLLFLEKVHMSGLTRSSLICSEVQIEKGQTSRNMIVRRSPGTEAAGLRKIESPNGPNLPIYTAAGRPGARFPPGFTPSLRQSARVPV